MVSSVADTALTATPSGKATARSSRQHDTTARGGNSTDSSTAGTTRVLNVASCTSTAGQSNDSVDEKRLTAALKKRAEPLQPGEDLAQCVDRIVKDHRTDGGSVSMQMEMTRHALLQMRERGVLDAFVGSLQSSARKTRTARLRQQAPVRPGVFLHVSDGTPAKLATVGVSAILEVVQRNPAGRETSSKGTTS